MAMRLTGVATGVNSAADAATRRGHQDRPDVDPELGRGGDPDGDHDQGRGGVADELPEDGGHDEQAGQQPVRPEAPDDVDEGPPTRSAAPVSNIAVDRGSMAATRTTVVQVMDR